MLSTDVAQQIRQLLSTLETATLFQRLLDLLDERQRLIDGQAGRTAVGGNVFNEAASHLHSTFASAYQALQGLSLRIVYKQIDKVADAFAAYEDMPTTGEPAGIAGEIHSFAGIVDNYSTSHDPKDAVQVLRIAANLRSRLEQCKVVLSGVLEKLEPATQIPEGYEGLTVVLHGEFDITGIIDVLQALNEICKRLEEVFQTLGIEVTFSLRKLETGSVSWELFAQRIGIAALKHLMTKGVAFWHRNYTTEGQLKFQVPLHANAIKEAVKLRSLLKREGMDVEGLDEKISEEAEFLVQRIGKITGHGQRVRVDGQTFDRESGSVPPLQVERSPLRLENGSPKSGDNQS